MSRVIRFVALSLVVLMMAGAAFAQSANQRVEGMKGVGYFAPVTGSDAPPIVGVRYWMNDGTAIDLGVGIGYQNNIDADDPGTTDAETTSLFDYAFDVGLPLVVHGEENMIVYFRPGVTIQGVQNLDASTPAVFDDKVYDINFRGEVAIGGEFFLGQLGWPNLSFSGQIGLGVDVDKPGTEGADSTVSFSTAVRDVSITQSGSLGFHIYF